MTQTPLPDNLPLRTTPAGTKYMDSSHGILPIHILTLNYVYVYATGNSAAITITIINITVPRYCSGMHHLSYASAIIVIKKICRAPFPHYKFDPQFLI